MTVDGDTLDPSDEWIAAWNDAGRAHLTELSERLAAFYAGDDSVDLDLADPRSQADADRVLRSVTDLNAAGRWQRARELFDPAWGPMLGHVEQNTTPLGAVALLGQDDILVVRGSPGEEGGSAVHLSGGEATDVPDVHGVTCSRNRDHLVLATSAGLELRDARLPFDRSATAQLLPWPTEATRFDVEHMQVSDDGQRVAVSCHRQGIFLASRGPGEPPWQQIYPDPPTPVADMTHVALSRDGNRLAWGHQDSTHQLAEIGPGGVVSRYADVGPLTEYPHFAAFSDSGDHVALNSCHFYSGATRAFAWAGNRDAKIKAYSDDPSAPVIDEHLRVYAGCWVPIELPSTDGSARLDGGFALAGAGVLRVVGLDGTAASVVGIGSSAGGVDYCPETGRLAVASHSGVLHVFDPAVEELPGRVDGVRALREVTRWLLWSHLPRPVRW